MRIAAIDIGTNSVRLLVAEVQGSMILPLSRELMTTRLGAGLMNTGFLSAEGKVATILAVQRFVACAQRLGAVSLTVFATSAMREASDGTYFARQLEAEIHMPVEILPFETEAAYSYTGVLRSLPDMSDAVVFDLGGGSCELIWRHEGQQLHCSKKIGAVYLTDRFLASDPPNATDIGQARRFIDEQLAACPLPARPLVGVGGTVTSLAAMVMEMKDYDPDRIHGYCLSRRAVSELFLHMVQLPLSRRQELPGIQKERAAILPAGTLVVEALLRVGSRSSLIVSEGDILLGSLYHASGLA